MNKLILSLLFLTIETIGFSQFFGGQIKSFNPDVTRHTCGATNIHNPSVTYGTMKDQEGNVYKTVQIGSQTWMAENLRTTKFRNGRVIPIITDNTQWVNNTTGACCSYLNNTANDCPYGKLYNWYAVINTNQLCPTGWHIPTNSEWSTLISSIAVSSVAGGSMKSRMYWSNPNTGATNSSGFSGVPAGYRLALKGFEGSFFILGQNATWWSSSDYKNSDGTSCAFSRWINFDISRINTNCGSKAVGQSVRCLKD